MKFTVIKKINLTVVFIFIITLVIVIVKEVQNTTDLLDKQIDISSTLQLQAYHEYLDASYEESISEVKGAINTFHYLLLALGSPNVAINANGKPDMKFGEIAPSQEHKVVDDLNKIFDCAATVLVKDKDSFIRVSTNLKNDSGARAVGTSLDPAGAAHKALAAGNSLFIITKLFGNDYLAGYEPIKNADGKVIGALFVGFKFDGLSRLAMQIERTHFLTNGFFAIYDTILQKAYAHTEGISDEEIAKLVTHHKATAGNTDGWVMNVIAHENSQYEIWCAYPISDYDDIINNTVYPLVIMGIIILILAIVIVSIVVNAIVGKPIRKMIADTNRISSGDFNIDLSHSTKDEIGDMYAAIGDLSSKLEKIIRSVVAFSEAVNAGANMEERIETAEKYQGRFKDMCDAINSLADAFYEPLKQCSSFIIDISEGKLPPKITADWHGEHAVLKNSINSCIDTINYLMSSINEISKKAKDGNLDYSSDTSKIKGMWQYTINGVNDIVNLVKDLIYSAGDTLSIMATGDLTPRITKEYKGKFGDMKNDINNLGNSLTNLISQLQEAIHTTASASAEISSTADTLAAATQEQSSQTDGVATAMEEMSKTVTNNAQSAIRTADVARNSGKVANNGGKVVQQTVNKMREIATVVRQSADNIQKLGESSKKIGEIISVIDDIADQTNLLSLNAAIEAARAGEQGRGFAVVADSVGKLAINTATATKEIADMIKGIQIDTDLAVKAMEKGTEEVQSGIELADDAGNSLKDILSGINELLDMVNQIAAASEQQSATSEQISRNVSSISKVSADSARNVEDVATTANELARMTDTLTSLVSQFKVNIGGESYQLPPISNHIED